MIAQDNIPQSEFNLIKNNSIFRYQLNFGMLMKREELFSQFKDSCLSEDLQMLDNGTLVIAQNLFGGKVVVSDFTCGLNFCFQLSNFFYNLKKGETKFNVTLGSDDYHSGWDYDFNIKIKCNGHSLIIVKDFDFRTEMELKLIPFIVNYEIFSKGVLRLFEYLYPDIKSDKRFKDCEKYIQVDLRRKFGV